MVLSPAVEFCPVAFDLIVNLYPTRPSIVRNLTFEGFHIDTMLLLKFKTNMWPIRCLKHRMHVKSMTNICADAFTFSVFLLG